MSYAQAWECTQMKSIAADFIKKQRANGMCETFQEAFAAIQEEFGMSYARAWECTQMIPIATDFIEKQRKEGKCEEHDDAIDAIKERYGESYARAWESTQMAPVAAAFIKKQRANGKCKEHHVAFVAIDNEFGPIVAQAWETTLMSTEQIQLSRCERKNEYIAEYATLAKARYESEQEKKRRNKEEATLRPAKIALKRYVQLLHEGKLHHLTRNDMKPLLNYIVTCHPKGKCDKPSKYTSVAKMMNRLGITIHDKVDCLTNYFPEE